MSSYAYDYRGRKISATDQNGLTTTYTYDDADRLTSVTDAAGNTTQKSYDTESNLLSITDGNGNTTSFMYDTYNRVEQTTFPSGLHEAYTYDAVGNLAAKTDRNGNTTSYVYDGLKRLLQKQYADSTSVEYTYDLVGRVKQVNDPTGNYGFAYDNMGRLIGTTTSYAFLAGQTFTNSYGYDAASNRTSFTGPDGVTTSYSYDGLKRITTMNNFWAGSISFGYDALSRRTSLNRPNGVNTSYQYDTLSHLLSVLHAGANDGENYTYDSVGNRTFKQNLLNGLTENYSYDKIYELTQVLQGTKTTESYTYDSVGNRLSALGYNPLTYNSSNELLSSTASTFTYDKNGNMLAKTSSSGNTQYTWDTENRLSTVTLPNNGGVVSFLYDPFGRRIQRTTATRTTVYLYDGSNVVAEANASGAVTASYMQGLGIDEPLAIQRGGHLGYYHADGLGSITSLTGAGGSTIATYIYKPFGATTATEGLFNPYRYTAREQDPETGLYYYRARYYEPQIGRFLSEDGLRFQASVNFFPYVGNNPQTFIDPSGYKPCTVDVRCWPIQKFNLGALGAVHCFLTVSGCNGNLLDISGGYDNQNKLHEWVTAAQPHPEATTYHHDAIPCKMIDCMVLTAAKINGLNLGYSALGGPNSNTAFATVLSACGLADLIQYAPAGAVAATSLF